MNTELNSKRIAIVGGGSAGWIAANLMINKWIGSGVDITLIESADIGTIGVGEGSTPHMKLFFDDIGVKEKEWMPKCNATYKNGIRFSNWSTKPGFTSYFHPFASKIDAFTAPVFIHNCLMRRQGVDIHAHPDRYYLASALAERTLSPINPENFPFDIGYGYHFDAEKLGSFLRSVACKRGVNRIEGHVVEIKKHQNGDVSGVLLSDGRCIGADFFIDCSGFTALLTEKTLNVPFHSYKESLFNDSAIALSSAVPEYIPSQTTSTAMKNGWCWEIPLTNRVGNGYVYSSDFCTADEAETELRLKLGLENSDVEARHLKMQVGRRIEGWKNNVLAIGLSQGFIEPLEATALHLTIESVKQFIQHLTQDNFGSKYRSHYNQNINMRFDAIRDYIVAHYRMSSRSDSEYWRKNTSNNHLPASLVDVIRCWTSGQDLNQKLQSLNIPGYYPPFSWHCLFAGYGIFPDKSQLVKGNETAYKYDLNDIDSFIQRSSLNFSSHKETINQLMENSDSSS